MKIELSDKVRDGLPRPSRWTRNMIAHGNHGFTQADQFVLAAEYDACLRRMLSNARELERMYAALKRIANHTGDITGAQDMARIAREAINYGRL
jgi:hypothetical protein